MNWRSLDRSRDWLAKSFLSLGPRAGKLGKQSLSATLCALVAVVAAQAVPACSSQAPAAAGGGGTTEPGTGTVGTTQPLTASAGIRMNGRAARRGDGKRGKRILRTDRTGGGRA